MFIKRFEKYVFLILFTLLFIFFTFYDLQLSNLIVNKTSFFGQFFYMFGELPGTFVGLVSLALLTVSHTKDDKYKNLNIIVFGLMTEIMGIILSFQLIRYLKIDVFPYLLFGLVLSIIVLYWANQLSDDIKQNIRPYAYVGFLTMALGVIVPNLLKIIWARPRYRILDENVLYQAWYIRSGITFDDNWKSFPSGHSATATVSLVYLYLPQLFNRLRGKERNILLIILTWIGCVMISRVIKGDHYMTDTLIGSGITLFIFIHLNRLFIHNRKESYE